nr:hypothetical protein [Aulosira sp. ZfuVER01]
RVATAIICRGMSFRFGRLIFFPILWVIIVIRLPTSIQNSKTGLFRLMTPTNTPHATTNGTDSIKCRRHKFIIFVNFSVGFTLFKGGFRKNF